jgi:large subunit ribosomal protein L23
MALFKRKKKTEEKKVDKKTSRVSDVKKEDKKTETKQKKPSMKDLYSKDSQKSTKAKSAKKEKGTEESKSMKELYSEGKPTTVVTKDGKKVKKERKYGNAYRVLVKPLVTEKATDLVSLNQYIFEVASQANKIEVAKAVQEVYGIKPVSVNIINMRGKNVNYGRLTGKRRDWKKAIVTLPEGKSINIYEGV